MNNIEKIMDEVKQTVQIHDSGIGIDLVSHDDGIVMEVKLYQIDKFMGLTELASIINKVLKRHETYLKGLHMKKTKEANDQIKKLLK